MKYTLTRTQTLFNDTFISTASRNSQHKLSKLLLFMRSAFNGILFKFFVFAIEPSEMKRKREYTHVRDRLQLLWNISNISMHKYQSWVWMDDAFAVCELWIFSMRRLRFSFHLKFWFFFVVVCSRFRLSWTFCLFFCFPIWHSTRKKCDVRSIHDIIRLIPYQRIQWQFGLQNTPYIWSPLRVTVVLCACAV